jgi:hypothetical protein
MTEIHLLYPNADDYKWKGDPNLSITGSGFSVPRGAESMFGYNSVVFNDTTVFDKYRVLSIDGLGDADISVSREDKPGDDGEDAYDMRAYLTEDGKKPVKTTVEEEKKEAAILESSDNTATSKSDNLAEDNPDKKKKKKKNRK